jgi:hypothetical protein
MFTKFWFTVDMVTEVTAVIRHVYAARSPAGAVFWR